MFLESIGLKAQASAIRKSIKHELKHWQLYVLVLLPIAFVLLFSYGPMYGIQIAFKDFIIKEGIMGSPWVGFKHFIRFFQDYSFFRVMKNTISLSFVALVVETPIPIIFALGLNELRNKRYKKIIQTVTYAPNFISTVVIVGLLFQMLDVRIGPVSQLFAAVGMHPVDFIAESGWFIPLYVLSDIWQYTGFSAIIYIAALSAVDPELYDAAAIDGANKLRKIWHVDIPGIMPTIVIMIILSIGSLIGIGFEKIYLMQNPLNLEASDVIVTYVYRVGLGNMQYSYSTAINLFSSLINFVLLIVANSFAKRITQTSLW